MPLETTESVVNEIEEELWIEEKEKFTAKTKLTIKFGPMEWPDLQTTTEAPPSVTEAEIDSILQTQETETEFKGIKAFIFKPNIVQALESPSIRYYDSFYII